MTTDYNLIAERYRQSKFQQWRTYSETIRKSTIQGGLYLIEITGHNLQCIFHFGNVSIAFDIVFQ